MGNFNSGRNSFLLHVRERQTLGQRPRRLHNAWSCWPRCLGAVWQCVDIAVYLILCWLQYTVWESESAYALIRFVGICTVHTFRCERDHQYSFPESIFVPAPASSSTSWCWRQCKNH